MNNLVTATAKKEYNKMGLLRMVDGIIIYHYPTSLPTSGTAPDTHCLIPLVGTLVAEAPRSFTLVTFLPGVLFSMDFILSDITQYFSVC